METKEMKIVPQLIGNMEKKIDPKECKHYFAPMDCCMINAGSPAPFICPMSFGNECYYFTPKSKEKWKR